ncbi:MAG: LptF/LptG family permease [Myxococcota bacterium]
MRTARTLSLYLMRETLVHGALCFLAVTLVLLAQNLLVRLDELTMIGMHPGDWLRLATCLVPVALTYAIPLAFLVGILLAARRLGSDGELLALRANGIGPDGVLIPNLLLGLCATALLAWLVVSLEHGSRRQLVSLFKTVAARGAILEPGKFRRIGKQLIFVEDRLPGGGLSGVMIHDTGSNGHAYRLFAERGRFEFDDVRSQIEIELWNGDVHLDPTEADPNRSARIHFDTFSVDVDVSHILGAEFGPVRPKQMTRAELDAVVERARGGDPLAELDQKNPIEYALEIQRRQTLPFAPLLFAGVGVPIALASEQRGRRLGLPLALAAGFAYFGLGTVSESIARSGWLPVVQASWIPNVLFALAAILLARFVRHRLPR